MIELRNVTKTYRTKRGVNTILDNVSIKFPFGENIGILGRNGAGKSTLLRVVAGIEMPDMGEVRRSGRISWPLGFAGGFNGSLSGEENCRFVARIYGEDCSRIVEYAHDFAEIGDYFHMPVRTYSSGMRARLAFGLSMAIDFQVYLVDEVTAVGDKRFKEKCKQAFADRSNRASIVMVSHSAATIREYCTRCLLLADGDLYLYEDVEQAIAAHEALQAQPSRPLLLPGSAELAEAAQAAKDKAAKAQAAKVAKARAAKAASEKGAKPKPAKAPAASVAKPPVATPKAHLKKPSVRPADTTSGAETVH